MCVMLSGGFVTFHSGKASALGSLPKEGLEARAPERKEEALTPRAGNGVEG
jgi:hypothetical protein